MLKIGQVELPDYPIFLAPMEDFTDPSFRYLCKEFGADMMYTEFISSEGLIRDGAKSVKKLTVYDYERPIGIQLYGNEIESMKAAARLAGSSRPDVIDINYGCPVKKIAGKGSGAGILRDIPLMEKITRAVVDKVKLPVTVKTRLGWDDKSKPIVEVAERLQDHGIQAITIHGRTRAQMYKGHSDWTLIREVKQNPRMKIPVIGNGDIDSPEKARQYFQEYGVDGIMIGRAAVGKPWIFRDVKHYLATGELLPPLPVKERVRWAKVHLVKSIEWKGAKRGVFEMRKHLSNYFKGLPHFKDTRLKLVTLTGPAELYHLLDRIAEEYGDMAPPYYPFWLNGKKNF